MLSLERGRAIAGRPPYRASRHRVKLIAEISGRTHLSGRRDGSAMTNVAGGFALALHGGAGTLRRGEMTAEREAACRAVACTCGWPRRPPLLI
jgi:hypothetical protein